MDDIPEKFRAELEEIAKRVAIYLSIVQEPNTGKWFVRVMSYKRSIVEVADSLEEAVSIVRNGTLGWEKSEIPENLVIPTWMGTDAEGNDVYLQEALASTPLWIHQQYADHYRN